MPEPRYETDYWNGIPHYICAACGEDTLQLTKITEHVASCSAGAALEPAPVEVPLSSPPDSVAPSEAPEAQAVQP